MKKILFVTILFCLPFFCFSQINGIEELKQKKVSFYCFQSAEAAQSAISTELELLDGNRTSYTEELFLTLENNLVIEKVNFMPDSEDAKKEIFLILNNQAMKNKLFQQGKKIKKLSSDYLVSVADLKTRLLVYLPSSQMYADSMAAKDLYLAALKNNKKSVSALIGYATWLYFAPPIAGGGYMESFKKCLEAEKSALCNEDLYFSLIYKSQVLYAMDRRQESTEALKQAHALFPAETFAATIGEINEKGYVFFDQPSSF